MSRPPFGIHCFGHFQESGFKDSRLQKQGAFVAIILESMPCNLPIGTWALTQIPSLILQIYLQETRIFSFLDQRRSEIANQQGIEGYCYKYKDITGNNLTTRTNKEITKQIKAQELEVIQQGGLLASAGRSQCTRAAAYDDNSMHVYRGPSIYWALCAHR